jgi:hypothetical protein
MLKRLGLVAVLVALVGTVLAVSANSALAHQCSTGGKGHDGPHKASAPTTKQYQASDPRSVAAASDVATAEKAGKKKKPVCKETPVQPNWRDNYIPLFDLQDRDDPRQRYEAQRWRDECEHHDREFAQQCAWYYGGTSFFPNRDNDEMSPNEAHAGFAATHCFLFEFAHQCEDHDESYGESVHDAHGGALYLDVCLTRNAESRYCQQGMADTQVGLTIMDHFPCGAPVPIVNCIDEYHVVRPFDTEYTSAQFDNTQRDTQEVVDDPHRYLCGFGPGAEDCMVPEEPLPTTADPAGVGLTA